MPTTGATKYYKAEDAASLDKALSAIAGAALGCTYKLDKTPDDPTTSQRPPAPGSGPVDDCRPASARWCGRTTST